MVISRHPRHWLSLGFLAATLRTTFAGAYWRLDGRLLPVVEPVKEPLVLGLVAVAVAGLLWLRPHLQLYVLGLLCVMLAFVGFWLASPDGGYWIGSNILDDPSYGPYGGRTFGYIFLLFPVGWILLATSVSSWMTGVVSYLLPGVTLVLVAAAAGLFGPPGYGPDQPPLWIPVSIVLAWPAQVLQVLGKFGRTFG
jgi:hypothetical protein